MPAQRLIVVTGVSRGLGRAMTEGFVQRGHTIAGCSRSPSAIDELGRRLGQPHQFRVVDVANDQDVASWAEGVLQQLGVPDILVNCAAVINQNSPLWDIAPDEFASVVDINIKGTFHTIRHFARPMIERGQGVVVNFSSYWGRTTSPDVAPYCASKWAIEGLTQALAAELPEGMAAVPLNPGIINTEMLVSCFGDSAASYPSAAQWAESSVPFILELGPDDNGQSITVPGF